MRRTLTITALALFAWVLVGPGKAVAQGMPESPLRCASLNYEYFAECVKLLPRHRPL